MQRCAGLNGYSLLLDSTARVQLVSRSGQALYNRFQGSNIPVGFIRQHKSTRSMREFYVELEEQVLTRLTTTLVRDG